MIATIPTARVTHVSPLGHARSKAAALVVQWEAIATVYFAPRNELFESCLNSNGGDGCPGALRFMATATQRAVAFIYATIVAILTAVATMGNVQTAHNSLRRNFHRKVRLMGDELEVRSRSCSSCVIQCELSSLLESVIKIWVWAGSSTAASHASPSF